MSNGILSPNAVEFQSLVRKLSDGALSQALQMHADPSDPKGFWLAQEAMSRKSNRDKMMAAQQGPQPTVAQQLAQTLAPAPAPAPMPMGVPTQGIPAAMPPAPPQMAQAAPPMPPQGMPAAMPPQAPPVAMAQAGGHVHDYGVASLPYEPRYEHGGIVSFSNRGAVEGDDDDDEERIIVDNPEEMLVSNTDIGGGWSPSYYGPDATLSPTLAKDLYEAKTKAITNAAIEEPPLTSQDYRMALLASGSPDRGFFRGNTNPKPSDKTNGFSMAAGDPFARYRGIIDEMENMPEPTEDYSAFGAPTLPASKLKDVSPLKLHKPDSITPQQAIAEQKALEEREGIDPNHYKNYKDKLTSREEKAEKEFDANKWAAALDFFGGMMSSPGNFGQQIGAAIPKGLSSLKESRKEYLGRMGEIEKLADMADAAERLESMGRIKEAQQISREREARINELSNAEAVSSHGDNIAAAKNEDDRALEQAKMQQTAAATRATLEASAAERRDAKRLGILKLKYDLLGKMDEREQARMTALAKAYADKQISPDKLLEVISKETPEIRAEVIADLKEKDLPADSVEVDKLVNLAIQSRFESIVNSVEGFTGANSGVGIASITKVPDYSSQGLGAVAPRAPFMSSSSALWNGGR